MDTQELPWAEVKLFLKIYESGSISAAARCLGIGQATASRRLSEFEAQLGTVLFSRQKQGVVPSASGERMLVPAKRMAEWAAEVSRAAAKAGTQLSGIIRVTAPPLLAATLLAQFAARLKRKHPELQLEILGTARVLDLQRGDADLAVRSVSPGYDELISVRHVTHSQHVYVARSLLKHLPQPYELATLPWLAWAPPFDALPPNPQLRALIPDFHPVMTTDDFQVMVAAAEAGVGALVLADPIAALLPKSNLVPLEIELGEHSKGEVHLVAAKSALAIPKVRVVADLLSAELKSAASGP